MADAIARQGKLKQRDVQKHLLNEDANIAQLHHMLLHKTYRIEGYRTFPIHDPKERLIYSLPYFPHRIVQHAIMNKLERLFVASFTADTYSCIKGRGTLAASLALRKALKDADNTVYCLKMDIRKFYPSVDHAILKQLLRRKIKDTDLLWLIDLIIDSADGLPIGNYLSQYLANYYLSGLDHYIKEQLRIKYYFRYADDMLLLGATKEELHHTLAAIHTYLKERLHLQLKDNYQVFPVAARGIDFVGYRHYHTHVLLRKSIKKRFARMMTLRPNAKSLAAYNGWTTHCNAKHLTDTLCTNSRILTLRPKQNHLQAIK